MELNELKDNAGARHRVTRVGRGIGSGKGKTCGRGVKGQKSRSGVSINGFEGGQMPIHRRVPKRGFNNPTRTEYAEVNLANLQAAVEAGKLDEKKPVDREALVVAGLVRTTEPLVKILGRGELKAKLTITCDKASKSAKEAVEKAGGSLTLPDAA